MPSGSTMAQPFIGRPVTSNGLTCGCNKASSPCSGPRRTINESFHTHTSMLPWNKNAMPPNIFFSTTPWGIPNKWRTRFASDLLYTMKTVGIESRRSFVRRTCDTLPSWHRRIKNRGGRRLRVNRADNAAGAVHAALHDSACRPAGGRRLCGLCRSDGLKLWKQTVTKPSLVGILPPRPPAQQREQARMAIRHAVDRHSVRRWYFGLLI